MVQAQDLTKSWEKLILYIQMGDFQRALALYRLLVSANDDQVYATKLKGDILWFCAPEKALVEYGKMADMYQKRGELDQALSVIKMLMLIAPEEQEYHLLYAKIQRTLKKESAT